MLTIFTIGAGANAGRSILMRLSGQRIVARLRQNTYASALRQDVEYVEKGEGDVVSRLSVDSSIVGESYVPLGREFNHHCLNVWFAECEILPSSFFGARLTQNLSDGLRAVIMASVGCTFCSLSLSLSFSSHERGAYIDI